MAKSNTASVSRETPSRCAMPVIGRRTKPQGRRLAHGAILEMGRFGRVHTDWACSVQGSWPHGHNVLDTPLQAGECLCSRSDCAFLMYKMFIARRTRIAKGTGSRLEIGQPSPLGRFPKLAAQVSHRTEGRQQQKVDIARLRG